MGKPRTKRHVARWAAIICAAILSLLLADYFAYPYGATTTGRTFNRGENGLWLRYTWYAGKKSDAELQALGPRLRDEQIHYAYFHVRQIEKSGSLAYHCPDSARRLIATVHRSAPEVRVLAWIYAGNRRGSGDVNLSNAQVRRKMVEETQWLVNACGFDGVQWDYEMCPDNDASFLKLMRETRVALPPGKLLSTATPMWLPAPLGRWGWSESYFAQVAATCDQIAVMCYDSGFWLPRGYVWLVRQQIRHVPVAIHRGNAQARVLFGIPTYGKGLVSHNPRAENIRLALMAVRDGLADSGIPLDNFAGVAPFADYTTDETDWNTYCNVWLKKERPQAR